MTVCEQYHVGQARVISTTDFARDHWLTNICRCYIYIYMSFISMYIILYILYIKIG